MVSFSIASRSRETPSNEKFFRRINAYSSYPLACTECKRRNYTTDKNKSNNPDRMELKKYCPWCRKHTLHRETR